MQGLADFLGKSLGPLPAWLFWPILFLITITAGIFMFSYIGAELIVKKRAYLGEKKK